MSTRGTEKINKFVPAAAAATLATVLTTIFLLYGGDDAEQVPEAVALNRPVDMALIYTEPEKAYNTLDGSYVLVYEDVIDSRRHCEFCTVIEFHDGIMRDGVTVSWAAERLFDIKGTGKVTFYVMGDEGGEKIRFNAAGKKLPDAAGRAPDRRDFSIKTKPVILTDQWEKFEIDLNGTDMTGVTNPLGIEVGEGQSARVWVKGLTLEDGQAEDPLPEEDGDGEDE